MNGPEGQIKILGTFVTSDGGRSMTKSSYDVATLELLGCANVHRKDGRWLFLGRRLRRRPFPRTAGVGNMTGKGRHGGWDGCERKSS